MASHSESLLCEARWQMISPDIPLLEQQVPGQAARQLKELKKHPTFQH